MSMDSQLILFLLLFILLLSYVISLDLKIGTVFKLHCQVTGKVYIGKTTVGIERAVKNKIKLFDAHKRGAYKSNDSVFEIFAHNNYNVTILEIIYKLANDTDFPLKLRKLQRFYIDENDNLVNKYVPSRTNKEYYFENFDHYRQYKKEYYENNREAMLQQNKVNYWDKRVSILKQKRVYYSRIKSFRQQKVTCEVCGVECSKGWMSQHKKTKHHLAALAKLNQSDTSASSEP